MGPRTDEDTISLLRHQATLYPDEVIAGILNRQGRKTATGERFTANQVGSLRRYRKIPRFQPPAEPAPGELATIGKAREDGRPQHFEDSQLAGGWFYRRRTNHSRRSMADSHHRGVAVGDRGASPTGLPANVGNYHKLGVSRQAVLQRVKRGELEALLVRQGRRKGLRIKVIDDQPNLL
jgi:hypothetical protein